MSPILLERTDFIKIGVTITLLLPGLFISGFIYGYSKAEDHSVSVRDSIAMQLPQIQPGIEAVREPTPPEVLTAGYDRDVDAADVAEQTPQQQVVSVELTQAGKSEDVADAAVIAEQLHDAPVQLGMGGPHVPEKQDPIEFMLDSADEESARFSVQIGLFGSQDNAERKVDELMAQRLNAYTTEFSRKQRTMHNVRFGYFATRKDAIAALDTYREQFGSDGYIVSIKR